MSLIGGVKSGVGGVRTTGGESAAATPPVTGIQELTSTGGTVTITDPTGPIANLEVAVAHPTLFDLPLSYGHGMDVDANLPAATSFWFTPTTIADLARADQVREWLVQEDIGFLFLDVVIDAANLVTSGGRFIVTADGLDTAIGIDVAVGVTTYSKLGTSALFSVGGGQTLGVRWEGSGLGEGSTLRAEIRLRGYVTGTPFVPPDLPINPVALFRPEDLALDGTSWVDSVAGNLYTVTVPADGPPPPGVDPISGPARISDGSFNGHPYGYFRHYAGGDFGHPTYTPCMLATDVAMFAPSAPPIPARTFAAVVRPESSIGGIVASSQFTTPCFKAALNLPVGDVLQAASFTQGAPGTGHNNYLASSVNLAGQEVVLVWRTDGTTLELFINGVKQPLIDDTIGTDLAAFEGFCIGNLASSKPIGKNGWQGAICFVGTWARKWSDDEVLSGTANLYSLYVTPDA